MKVGIGWEAAAVVGMGWEAWEEGGKAAVAGMGQHVAGNLTTGSWGRVRMLLLPAYAAYRRDPASMALL